MVHILEHLRAYKIVVFIWIPMDDPWMHPYPWTLVHHPWISTRMDPGPSTVVPSLGAPGLHFYYYLSNTITQGEQYKLADIY
jgi:hypothetical protein